MIDEELTITKDRDTVYFSYKGFVDQDTCQIIQDEEGYHPGGYGFFAWEFIPPPVNLTKWQCRTSCD